MSAPFARTDLRRASPSAGEVARDDDTEQVQLLVGMRAFERTDEDREALDVLVHVLGGGMSSRLFDEIREQRGLAYSVYAGASLYDDAGAVSVYAGTQPQHVDQVRTLIDHELDRMLAGGITDEELEVATGYLTGSFVLGLEDTGSRMARAGGQLISTGTIRSVEEQLHAVAAGDPRRRSAGRRTGARCAEGTGHRRSGLTQRRVPNGPEPRPTVRIRCTHDDSCRGDGRGGAHGIDGVRGGGR